MADAGIRHCHDALVVHRLLADAGLTAPHTGEPYTEAMLAGLGGGIGFMGALFEYQGLPPMVTWVLRYHPQDFIEGALERAGVSTEITRTGGGATAAKQLAATLDEGRQALIVGSRELLAWHHLAPGTGGPFDVRVLATADDGYAIDDGATDTARLTTDQLAAFRAADKKLKHRSIVVSGQNPDHDLATTVAAAIDATVANFTGPVIGNSFDVNFGLTGLERVAQRLTDTSTKNGWPRIFSGDRAAQFAGLRRVFDCIEIELSADAGMRPLYADFLDEAAPLLSDRNLPAAAEAFRRSGERWSTLSRLAVEGGDGSFADYRGLAIERQRLLDTDGQAASEEIGQLTTAMADLADGDPMDDDTCTALLADMSELVTEILAIETDAVERLSA